MNKDKLLNKFLTADLSSKEEERFLHFLETDAEFAQDVKIHSLVYADRNLRLKEYLSDVGTSNPSLPSHKQTKLYIRLLKLSAAILALAIGSIYIYQFTTEKHVTELVEEISNDTYPAPGLLSSDEQDIDFWKQAIVYYSSKDYAKAITEISQIDSLNSEHKLYLSLSEMKLDPPYFTTAIERLESIYGDSDNMHQDATSWHLALAYLNSNQKEKAKALLVEISESKHFKKAEALKILKHFDSL